MPDDPTRTPDRAKRARGGDGKFTRNIDTAERDAAAARMRADSRTYADIAAQLGYASEGAAHDGVARALAAAVQEPATELRQLELDRLDRMYQAVLGVLEREHVTVSNGRIVRGEDDKAILDDGPVLNAVDRLLRIQERRAKLLGLDAPAKQELGGSVVLYRVEGVDMEAMK